MQRLRLGALHAAWRNRQICARNDWWWAPAWQVVAGTCLGVAFYELVALAEVKVGEDRVDGEVLLPREVVEKHGRGLFQVIGTSPQEPTEDEVVWWECEEMGNVR